MASAFTASLVLSSSRKWTTNAPPKALWATRQEEAAEDNKKIAVNGTAFPPLEGESALATINGGPLPNTTPASTPGEQQQMPVPSIVSELLSIDPETVRIQTTQLAPAPAPSNETEAAAAMRSLPFVNMFRGSANYIANHRNTIAVYHIPGGLLDLSDPTVFADLMNDVALTWLLGMKIVLVVGCRHQLEKRLPHAEQDRSTGLRVTTRETLRVVKEEAGYVRFEVERQLARSLRMQGGFHSAANGNSIIDGNVVSGNFFSAQPFGILDGTDYQ